MQSIPPPPNHPYQQPRIQQPLAIPTHPTVSRPDQIICFRAISYEDGLVGGGGIAQTGIVGPGKAELLVVGKGHGRVSC